jgi:hypothetical protein
MADSTATAPPTEGLSCREFAQGYLNMSARPLPIYCTGDPLRGALLPVELAMVVVLVVSTWQFSEPLANLI